MDEFLKAFSLDGSSKSSSGEADDLLSKLFEAVDSNSDGSISKDEQKAFQAEAQARRQERGPPPSSIALGASQAYGSGSQLGGQALASAGTYARAA